MIGWLKWLVAGRDMEELERWRVECAEAERWLAEFPDAVSALGYVRSAVGAGGGRIEVVRDSMRARRDRLAGFNVNRAACGLPAIDGNGLVRGYQPVGGPMPPPPGPRGAEEPIDGNALLAGDPAAQVVADLHSAIDHMLSLPIDREPTHYDGLVARDGVAYRFLSAECGDQS